MILTHYKNTRYFSTISTPQPSVTNIKAQVDIQFQNLHYYDLSFTRVLNPYPLSLTWSLNSQIIPPVLLLGCGLNPSCVPSIERFSSFLRDTDNAILQTIRNSLVKELIYIGEISGKSLSIDSYPIQANVKENNLKTSIKKNRFDKQCIPKGDPDCRLGVTVHFLPYGKKVSFFWGYRNHVITHMPSELPVIEVTKPANVADLNLFIPLFRQTKNTFNITPKIVLADSIYDSEKILSFVIDELKAMPRIAHNYRWKKHRHVKLSPRGNPICLAGFEMIYWGKFKDRGKIRKKFCCPITHSKKFDKKHPACHWNHPIFVK